MRVCELGKEILVVADRDQLGATPADLFDRAAHALERTALWRDHDCRTSALDGRNRPVQQVG